MKLLALTALLIPTATACMDDDVPLTGSVLLTGGTSGCTDEDGDQALARIAVYGTDGRVASQDIGCSGASFEIMLDPGTYSITVEAVTADPIWGFFWAEDTMYFDDLVIDDATDLGVISLSVE
jgi:hypothetical protein